MSRGAWAEGAFRGVESLCRVSLDAKPALWEIYTDSLVSYSIVAVHGLGASPNWAWIRKVKNGSEEAHVNWLANEMMLPAKLPTSRIMTFNYISKWLLGAPKQRRSSCAIQLLTALDNQRKKVCTLLGPTSTYLIMKSDPQLWQEKNTKYRPLIFIGHSFGGVVIEQVGTSCPSNFGIGC